MKMTRDEFDNLPLYEKIGYLERFTSPGELWDLINEDHIVFRSADLLEIADSIEEYLTNTGDGWMVMRAVLNNLSDTIDDANKGSGWIHCERPEYPYGYAQLTARTLSDIVSEYVGTEAYDSAFGEQGPEVFCDLERLL